MAESNTKLLSLKKLHDQELRKLNELEKEYHNNLKHNEGIGNLDMWQEITKKKYYRLMSELSILENSSPNMIPINSELLLSTAQQTLAMEVDDLLNLKKNFEARKESLLITQKKVQFNMEGEQRLFEAVKQKCISQGLNIQNLSAQSVDHTKESDADDSVISPIVKLQEKVNKLKNLSSIRNTQIVDFLSKYFPAPDDDRIENTIETDIFSERSKEPMKSLEDIIHSVLVSYLNNPQNPWITIDSTFWVPHVEFLLRCGIVIRNPDNASLLKLQNFEI